MDLNSGTSSVAYSNWRYVNNVYGLNDLQLTRSNFDLGHRITGLVSYKLDYLNDMLSTQISLFYNGQSGQPVSYIYSGDMNNDGTSNDMIYIPATASEINLVDITGKTAAQQWTDLDAFISNDKYLSKHRGEYAERNAARLPFFHQFDLRILQDIKVKAGNTSNKLQISLDVINIANLLNKKWGESLYLSNQQYSLINYTGLTATNLPKMTYSPSGLTRGEAFSISDFSSRWRMQIGLRYVFN
jgi:hypothetical protein